MNLIRVVQELHPNNRITKRTREKRSLVTSVNTRGYGTSDPPSAEGTVDPSTQISVSSPPGNMLNPKLEYCQAYLPRTVVNTLPQAVAQHFTFIFLFETFGVH